MPASVSIIITGALVFYTIGVWWERLAKTLKLQHLFFFYAGLICDTVGTGMMFRFVGGMTYDLHGLSGLLAIILMLAHALWATIVLVRNDEGWKQSFSKFSIFVWVVWLIPYFSPMFLAISKG